MDKVSERLYVGDIEDFRNAGIDRVDTIISVSTLSLGDREQLERPIIHIPLRDGSNNQLNFTQAVDAVKREIEREGTTVLVTCMKGVSRSPTVAATALASLNNNSFEDELERIKESRPKVNPLPPMMEQARLYLGESF